MDWTWKNIAEKTLRAITFSLEKLTQLLGLILQKLRPRLAAMSNSIRQRIVSAALLIKSNQRIFNIIATVFFLMSLSSGVIWAIGVDIEPVAFTLSMLASAFFGMPHLAEFIVPSRKAVKDMTHNELLELVKTSDPKKEWKGISNNWVSEVFLKEDPRLRFRAKYSDEGVQNEDYKDPWANNHPNPRATGYWYDLFYDGNLIERFVLVAVDGARAEIPAPDWQTGKITKMHYQVALINDSLGTVDEYIRRSRLTVDLDN